MPAFNFLSPADILAQELVQRDESGYDVSALRDEVGQALVNAKTGDRAPCEEHVVSLLDKLAGAQVRNGMGLPRTKRPRRSAKAVAACAHVRQLRRRQRTSRIGSSAPGSAGAPAVVSASRWRELWTGQSSEVTLTSLGLFPSPTMYPPSTQCQRGSSLRDCWAESTRGRIEAAPRDDDTDYTILGLHMLETYGPGLSTDEIAREWLDHLPFTQTYTAERVAYRNLVNGMSPPAAAVYRNPYREWIGAQIRADIYGYVHPGQPPAGRRVGLARRCRVPHSQRDLRGHVGGSPNSRQLYAHRMLSTLSRSPSTISHSALGSARPSPTSSSGTVGGGVGTRRWTPLRPSSATTPGSM